MVAPLDHSTLPPTSLSDPGASRAGTEMDGLAILWSRHEPDRIGEALLIAAGDPGPWTFGRGDTRTGDAERRVLPVRQRPGALVPTGPLVCPRISRAQLRLGSIAGGGLAIENVGSCPLVYGGREVTYAAVAPGEVVALRNELLLLCVHRVPIPPALTLPLTPTEENDAPLHPFGEADASGMVGESPILWELRHRIAAVARHRAHVLILGESGSGKELVARALHARSARGRRPLVSRNAATIPEGLADAELFGNLRNYPNAGMPERPGLVGEAHGSTLFLDEFAELPQGLQAHLLRVLDEGEYQRLGESTMRRSDLRVIAASNRPERDIKPDVLARLKIRITLPSLNARREDIPLLVTQLLRRHATVDPAIAERFFPDGDPRAAPRISPVLMEAFVQRHYTTHVRELDALLLRAVLEGRGRYVELPPALKGHGDEAATSGARNARDAHDAPDAPDALTQEERARLALLRKHRFSPTACGRDPAYHGNRQRADLHFRQLICRALRIAAWNIDGAAALLAGGDARALEEKVRARIAAFVSNLRARIEEGATEKQLERSLAEEWKGGADAVLEVVAALREGKLGAPPG
ncbi:sigma 54-interacting transcriptional regulator [Chondromyces apiculatus]|uniref:Sigma-54 factor interaction domain-containing protein n=1 Tax=Chondromyces apiculatus DSM 436 TaxID=1192034 RepID=A0A017TGK1_9BACT|nr:sigma 54-interacting transcriptional regulator [Chondromyces apiculatus]EYF07726.1 Hypothetical protein CAP_8227 [Chondromyces apiculatus DSM 436]